jgi:hypothetical protein
MRGVPVICVAQSLLCPATLGGERRRREARRGAWPRHLERLTGVLRGAERLTIVSNRSRFR